MVYIKNINSNNSHTKGIASIVYNSALLHGAYYIIAMAIVICDFYVLQQYLKFY